MQFVFAVVVAVILSSVIAGAICIVAGSYYGKQMAYHEKPVYGICGCSHHKSYHKDKAGKDTSSCQFIVDEVWTGPSYDRKLKNISCSCQNYVPKNSSERLSYEDLDGI